MMRKEDDRPARGPVTGSPIIPETRCPRRRKRIRAERQRNRLIYIGVLAVIFILAIVIGYIVGKRDGNNAGTAFILAGNFFKTRILSYSSAFMRMLYL